MRRSEIEIRNVKPSDIMELHQATSEALAHTMDNQESEKTRLDHRIVELEAALSPCPLFTKPLAIVQSVEESQGQACKIDRVTRLLYGVRSLLVEGIKERKDLSFKAFVMLENVHKIGTRT